MQVFSLIPESYPGHSILTEDEGVLLGDNSCGCGIKGKYFRIIGRMKTLKLEDVVMLMNKLKKDITFETNPKFFLFNKVEKSFKAFNENVISFFDELSNHIFQTNN